MVRLARGDSPGHARLDRLTRHDAATMRSFTCRAPRRPRPPYWVTRRPASTSAWFWANPAAGTDLACQPPTIEFDRSVMWQNLNHTRPEATVCARMRNASVPSELRMYSTYAPRKFVLHKLLNSPPSLRCIGSHALIISGRSCNSQRGSLSAAVRGRLIQGPTLPVQSGAPWSPWFG